MPDGYRLLWAGWYRLEDGAGPYAWDGAAGFTLKGSGGGVAAGGAALLADETDGFAVDFTHPVDAERIALKVASAVTAYGLDAFLTQSSISPKQVWDVSGNLTWSPHNMYIQSETPATRTVNTVIGQNYTVSVVGSGSLTGSVGASGVATQASPLTYTASAATSTFTLGGSLTRVQMNRGAVATAYLATTAAARYGMAVDYDPITHAARGLFVEPAATNLLLNNATLSTQSVTVTAVTHTLSFWGTGTVTNSGVSTTVLNGTGANDRVQVSFVPTAGSLTLTVSGTVSRAQLEIGSVASSPIPTYSASVIRPADFYTCTAASINHSATAGSWWAEFAPVLVPAGNTRLIGYNGSAFPLSMGSSTALSLIEGTTLSKTLTALTAGTIYRAASAFASGSRAVTGQGLAVAADAGATTLLLSPTTIYFGSNASATSLNGYIRKLYYLPRRMADADLATETT